ncbi:MAG: helix-turn-helix domain-containing protein [Candidatus Pacebacteria bacterium]|jgi:uncharacterized protein YerC|nr:hypothetical protein [bacterium]MDP6527570.1 helix-turn-helix domain-containing protein [Candidatus Paceibacterota bacterium]MDP6659832.1 helix-turn-helix domain-containing protein [Candidatus Paceibacterota bacterium]|tara:strand:+ start:41951 stop:42352 length:402 start_codon:yes stop_codon:yes gene_type:complete
MPHISQKKVGGKIKKSLERHLYALFGKTGTKTRIQVLEELLTETETIMLAKRIGMILLIKKGVSLYKISDLLGVSPSTAERFKLEVELGKYRHTSDWVWRNSKDGSLDALLESIVALAFTGRTRSFKKFMDEL